MERNPLELSREALAKGIDPKDYVVNQLKSGELKFSCDVRITPRTSRAICLYGVRTCWVHRVRVMSISSSTCGTTNGVQGKDLGQTGDVKPQDVIWHDEAPEGKLDLLVTLDFRMSTTCLYSDIVLPTATLGTKRTISTHRTCTPLSIRCQKQWILLGKLWRSDWEIYKGFADDSLSSRTAIWV